MLLEDRILRTQVDVEPLPFDQRGWLRLSEGEKRDRRVGENARRPPCRISWRVIARLDHRKSADGDGKSEPGKEAQFLRWA
jgi:hypothetical protein